MCSKQIHRLVVFCCFIISFFAMISFADDIDALKERLATVYKAGKTAYGLIAPDSAANYLSLQRADGSWSDINYADASDGDWKPRNHLHRLFIMSIAFNRSGHPNFLDTAMLRGIIAGLDYWYVNDAAIGSGNWWHNDIGQQLYLGPLLIIMEAHLDAAHVQRGSNFLNDPSMSGQNLIWYASETIWRGCLRHSIQDINSGLNAIKGECRIQDISLSEGIQADFSFHMHNFGDRAQLYSGGYGRAFLDDLTFWVLQAQGLSFAFDAARLSILMNLILDGSQWMIRRNDWDYATGGREISRPGWMKFNPNLKDMLPLITSSRHAELQAFVDHTNGTNDSALTGDRHFWLSDYHVHRAKGFHFSIRMCSNRFIGAEDGTSGMGENLKHKYIGFGANTILRKGDEYFGIYPIWDWCRIPGVTAPQNDPTSSSIDYGTTDFVGGVSDGKHGAVGFDLNWEGVTGRKAWFCFGNEVVALGAGIASSVAFPVYTSINQCWLSGSVWAENDSGPGSIVTRGIRTLEAPRWVFHDSIGYVFPHPAPVTLKNDIQSGSGYSIDIPFESPDVVSGDVFSLWLDHGQNFANTGYEYIVVPGKNKADIQDYAQRIPIHTLVNTADIQAVSHDSIGVTGMVFYKAGRVIVHPFRLAIEVDKPCIVLLDESGLNYHVTVANPLSTAVTVNINLSFNNGLNEQIPFSLLSGKDAGKSLTKTSVSPVIKEKPSDCWVKVTAKDKVTSFPLARVQVMQKYIIVDPVLTDSLGVAVVPVMAGRIVIQCSKPFYSTSTDTLIAQENDTADLSILLGPAVHKGLHILPESLCIAQNSQFSLSAFYEFSDGSLVTMDSGAGLVWTSRLPDLVGVNGSGVLTSNTLIGKCFIIASLPALGFSDSIAVNIIGALYHWPLDEGSGASASDATGHGNTSAFQGAPEWVAGKYGGALAFDGVDDYLSTALSISVPNFITLSLWFKTTTTTGGKLIGFGNTQTGQSGSYGRHLYMNNAGKIYFSSDFGGENTISTPFSYNDDRWHHAAATFSSEGMMLYVDGALQASNPAVISSPGGVDGKYCRIGFDNIAGWPSAPSSNYFSGQLDDISVYDIALSANTIAAIAGSNATDKEPVIKTPESLDLVASPNPFNPSARISFYLPQKAAISLTLYNPQGKMVKELVSGMVLAGRHMVQVEAGGLASGIYICELKSNATVKRLKLVLMR